MHPIGIVGVTVEGGSAEGTTGTSQNESMDEYFELFHNAEHAGTLLMCTSTFVLHNSEANIKLPLVLFIVDSYLFLVQHQKCRV